jgi:hypothetical protein
MSGISPDVERWTQRTPVPQGKARHLLDLALDLLQDDLVRQLGLDQARGGQPAVHVEHLVVSFDGAVIADDRIPDRFLRQIRDGLDNAVRLGRLRPVANGTT